MCWVESRRGDRGRMVEDANRARARELLGLAQGLRPVAVPPSLPLRKRQAAAHEPLCDELPSRLRAAVPDRPSSPGGDLPARQAGSERWRPSATPTYGSAAARARE